MLTKQRFLTHKAFQLLNDLPLETGEYAIVGSGIMFALGIRKLETLDDLDLLVTGPAWQKVKYMAPVIHDEKWACDHLSLYKELIEIWNGWGNMEGTNESYKPELIIKNAATIGSFPFMSLEDSIRWKTEMGREKDKQHLAMIEEYLRKEKQMS